MRQQNPKVEEFRAERCILHVDHHMHDKPLFKYF
jgi:hypothetical protein